MADRFWVGGAGTWSTTSTTNWSATSGGAGGASVPTAADSVFFNQAGTYTVTMTGALLCLDFNVSAGAVTFATGTAPSLTISGSMSITNVTPTWTSTGTILFNATTTGKTITTNGTSFAAPFTFNGIGGVWTLGSSLTTTNIGAFAIANGTLNTSSVGNYGITSGGTLTMTSSATAFLNLNASTVTLSSNVPFSLGALSVFNAGTSQINCTYTAASISVAGGNKTFYNLAFTGATASGTAVSITGQNVFNNLSITGPTAGFRPVLFAANQTINGVLSTNSTAGNRRVFFYSSTIGMQWDLTVNATPSLTDADFRDLRVIGTAAPISGTRIGNLRGCSGITFSAPKTVYYASNASGNWQATVWSDTSGGTPSTAFQPLAQDTAVIDNSSMTVSSTLTLDASVPYFGSLVCTKTSAFNINGTAGYTIYGDFTLNASANYVASSSLTFSGRNTQTITSAGKTISGAVTIDSVGGTVQLADAFACASTFTLTEGTFNTAGFAALFSVLSSSGTRIRALNLSSSAVTIPGTTALSFASTNFTFNAGTSTITLTSTSTSMTFISDNLTFNNVVFTGAAAVGIGCTFTGAGNTFNNLTFPAPATGGVATIFLPLTMTVTNTLTCAGASPTRRIFLQSSTVGTPSVLTVGTLSATDADFRDITIAGAAASGSTQTRLGNLGGNSPSGLFPAGKTVYWNLTGSQNWSATAWASSSGGTPDVNNFPLAQDTAVFDNTGAATTVTIEYAWNISSFDASTRSTAMSLVFTANTSVYGDFKLGTGITFSGTGTTTFRGRGTQTILTSGKTITKTFVVDNISGTVQLADAFLSSAGLTLNTGTFDAAIYSVTALSFASNVSTTRTLRMGTGVWTLSGTGTVWNVATTTGLIYYPGTSTIVLSDTTTTARTFTGNLYYNKLTIGGATGISTLSTSAMTIGELASTKTVAHTISLGSVTIGKWSVTGTVGNVVTVSGTITLAGERVSGVNYLALGTTTITATNPVEFYAGANSTGTGGAINTAAPAAVTRYWRGGTGTWDATTTTNWSATSGGAGGASVPTSADTVIFNTLSNNNAYTVTLTATQLRCASLSIVGPTGGTGIVTFAGTAPLSITQSLTMASTGITRTYTGQITFAGTGVGKTISAGTALNNNLVFAGIGASWSLSAALSYGLAINVNQGTFDTANFAVTGTSIATSVTAPVTLSLGSSALTLTSGINLTNGSISSVSYPYLLTFNRGTSTVSIASNGIQFYPGGQSFYNVNFTDTVPNTAIPLINTFFPMTFNNLTMNNPATNGIKICTISANITVEGTLTFTQTGANGIRRISLFSDTIGTQRTITAAAVTGLTDIDFRDINCAGTGTWTGGTRIGDCGGNSGSFSGSTPKTVYWNLVGGGNWGSAVGWATTSGGTPALTNLPLAQDTAIIQNTGLNTSNLITLDQNWHIGTVDMSTRTNAMTLASSTISPTIYGDWTFGTGVTHTNIGGTTIFAKRGTQTITSNGRTFATALNINSANGTVQLADDLRATATGASFTLASGGFNAVSYNVTVDTFNASANAVRTLSLGSGLWTIGGTGTAWNISVTNGLTFNRGTANIISSPIVNSSILFSGGGLTYNKLTIGGGSVNNAGFTIGGDNTFLELASTRTVAYSILLTTNTQRVAAFTAKGSAGALLTINGQSVGAPGTLIYTGTGNANLDYLNLIFVRVYDPFSEWYAGTNSTNGGSYGWFFTAAASAINGQFFAFF